MPPFFLTEIGEQNVVFWEIWRHRKDILKLTDFYPLKSTSKVRSFKKDLGKLLHTYCIKRWRMKQTYRRLFTIPFARHYKPRFVFFYSILTLAATYIADNICTKNGNSSFFWAQNPRLINKSGFKSRATYDGAHTVFPEISWFWQYFDTGITL